jgi:hypothetical protein
MIGIRVGDAEVDIASVMNRGGENGYEANKDNEETHFKSQKRLFCVLLEWCLRFMKECKIRQKFSFSCDAPRKAVPLRQEWSGL